MSTGGNNKRNTGACNFFTAHGTCRFGDKCRFAHISNQSEVAPSATDRVENGNSSRAGSTVAVTSRKTRASAPSGSNNVNNSPQNPTSRRRVKPCREWQRGSCKWGTQCRFSHDIENTNQLSERQSIVDRDSHTQEEGQRRIRELALQSQERIRQEKLAEREREKQALEAGLKTRAAKEAEENAKTVIQRVTLGSLVTFAAGLDIPNLITGFETCTVRIKNLPTNAREAEVSDLFTQQGINPERFQILRMRPVQGKQIAEVVTDAEMGNAIAAGLADIEFRDDRLTFEVGAYNIAGMGNSSARDSEVLTISWRGPSTRYIVEFDDMEHANRRARALDGQIFQNRRLKVEMNTPPPGRTLLHFRPNSVKISNLPSTASDVDVAVFAGSESYLVKRLPGGVYNLEDGLGHLRNEITQVTPFLSFEQSPSTNPEIVTFRVRFRSWDDAHRAQEHLTNRGRLWYLGNITPWTRLPSPMLYTLTIPSEQYRAQKAQWTSLRDGLKDKDACNLLVHEDGAVVRIRVAGSVKPAVGALKVRVESLAAGEKVEGWHHALTADTFGRRVLESTGGFMRVDWRQRTVKVYGDARIVEHARGLIRTELERLSAQEITRTLKKQSVGFFVRGGLQALKDAFGPDSVKFSPATRQITITGGEDALHTLNRLIDESLTGTNFLPTGTDAKLVCPVCYDAVSSPVQLGCSHVYCLACIRHLLTSAMEPTQEFPLVCMGDETRCRVPIAIPTIQRLLNLASFSRLLEIAFVAHVSKNPASFKYCQTPDCNQLYRATAPESPSAVQCPSCFAVVCSSCHDDGHEGMSCAENKLHKSPEEQDRMMDLWLGGQGGRVKKCPQCSIPIEKTEGCNHMSCRCGAHICWRCMDVFAADTIYQHMHTAHGGIHDEGPVQAIQDVDYLQQEELLRQARWRHQIEARAQARLEEDRFRRQLEMAQAAQADRDRRALEHHGQRVEAAIAAEQARRRQQDRGGWNCTVM